MQRNKRDDKELVFLSQKYGISIDEVRRIVYSFFDIIQLEAKRLPFDTPTRIFSKDKFNEYVSVYQIPYIGRIGPAYSRYLKWRKNESELIEQSDKSSLRKESRKKRAERIARTLLYGETSDCVIDMKPELDYKRVWIVGVGGKKLAKQIIPKKD